MLKNKERPPAKKHGFFTTVFQLLNFHQTKPTTQSLIDLEQEPRKRIWLLSLLSSLPTAFFLMIAIFLISMDPYTSEITGSMDLSGKVLLFTISFSALIAVSTFITWTTVIFQGWYNRWVGGWFGGECDKVSMRLVQGWIFWMSTLTGISIALLYIALTSLAPWSSIILGPIQTLFNLYLIATTIRMLSQALSITTPRALAVVLIQAIIYFVLIALVIAVFYFSISMFIESFNSALSN